MKRLIATATLLALLITGTASASNKYTVYGAGTVSCGKWTEARKGDIQDWGDISAWVLGWVSAAGAYRAADLRHVDSDALNGWVDKYCMEHPLDEVAEAAEELVVELSKKK